MDAPSPRTRHVWRQPALVLALSALLVFSLTLLWDLWHSTVLSAGDIYDLLARGDPRWTAGIVQSTGEVVAGVLAVAITVVAIVVELAASRYTHRITELFITEPVNFAVLGTFVITALQAVWVQWVMRFDPETGVGFVPWVGMAAAVVLVTISLLALVPYFAYVLAFIDPENIVGRIRSATLRAIARGPGGVATRHREALRGVDQLSDVALNSMERKDKFVAMAAIGALQSMLETYRAHRGRNAPEWFEVSDAIRRNPDFVSMAPEILDRMADERLWFETKILRQYQTLYAEALGRMRDIGYLVAIDTRRVGEAAMRESDAPLAELSIKFFNTYLRAALNARDVRSAYNLLHQYRQLAEAAIECGEGARAAAIVEHMRYYGHVAYATRLPFVIETCAYDICALGELAYDRGSDVFDRILEVFLELDQHPEGEVQERSLRGVRKAQVKLASHFLEQGDEGPARRVFDDMRSEPPERLASIRDELLAIESPDFWEITDRGVNLDYVPPARRACIRAFFEWWPELPRAHA
jgi:hypothetical protein